MKRCEQCNRWHERIRFCSNKCKDKWHEKRRGIRVRSAAIVIKEK